MAGLLKNFRHVTVVQADERAFAWASDTPLGLTANGISIYYAAKTSQDPKLKDLAADPYVD